MDNLRIAKNFSAAAKTYNAHADLQRSTADYLLTLTPCSLEAGTIVDLGCGTGYSLRGLASRFGPADLLALDPAPGMAASAAACNIGMTAIGQAEKLPIRGKSCSLIFSNMVFQWCQSLSQVFAECLKVLKPGGYFCFSLPDPTTLQELRQSWSHVDSADHVHRFPSAKDVRAAVLSTGMTITGCEILTYRIRYDSLLSLMKYLQNIGAANTSSRRRFGLTAPSVVRRIEEIYPQRTEGRGIWATWGITYIRAVAPAEATGNPRASDNPLLNPDNH